MDKPAKQDAGPGAANPSCRGREGSVELADVALSSDGRPRYSVVIPTHNRRDYVLRAIRSCLGQTGPGIEVLVVDDGSTDGTREAVAQLLDPRLRLIVHATNRGVCPARNSGAAAAQGEWVVFLDSDDELLPGAIDRIDACAVRQAASISALRFLFALDDGGISPHTLPPAGHLDYAGMLRWQASCSMHQQDTLLCVRGSAFSDLRYPDSRAFELGYFLDLHRHFEVVVAHDVVAALHYDAPTSLSRTIERAQLLRAAADQAQEAQRVLTAHGAEMQRLAPILHWRQLRRTALHYLLAGERGKGCALACAALRQRWMTPEVIVMLVVGLLGKRWLARLRELQVRSMDRYLRPNRPPRHPTPRSGTAPVVS